MTNIMSLYSSAKGYEANHSVFTTHRSRDARISKIAQFAETSVMAKLHLSRVSQRVWEQSTNKKRF